MSLPIIRPETPADRDAIRAVNDAAFGGTDESALVDALRAAGLATISLLAEQDDRVLGHILFSPLGLTVDGHARRALALAPMAVDPAYQRRGIGSALIRTGLDRAQARDWQAAIVLGHLDYYPRFGFSAALAAHIASPFTGPHFMGLELIPGSLAGVSGTAIYPAPFGVFS